MSWMEEEDCFHTWYFIVEPCPTLHESTLIETEMEKDNLHHICTVKCQSYQASFDSHLVGRPS